MLSIYSFSGSDELNQTHPLKPEKMRELSHLLLITTELPERIEKLYQWGYLSFRITSIDTRP
jgi:hypothetical protein